MWRGASVKDLVFALLSLSGVMVIVESMAVLKSLGIW